MPVPNDAEIGCTYDQQSSAACPRYDAAVPAHDAGQPVEAAVSEAGEAGAVPSGLGNPCVTSADCASFGANYCLISPTGGFASFCTATGCTPAACGTSYVCCDCSASPISLVNVFPANICALPKTASALPSYGCTCDPQET